MAFWDPLQPTSRVGKTALQSSKPVAQGPFPSTPVTASTGAFWKPLATVPTAVSKPNKGNFWEPLQATSSLPAATAIIPRRKLQHPADFESESKNIDSYAKQLEQEDADLQTLAKTIDTSDEKAVTAYNTRLQNLQGQVISLKKNVDSFNSDLNEYNGQITAAKNEAFRQELNALPKASIGKPSKDTVIGAPKSKYDIPVLGKLMKATDDTVNSLVDEFDTLNKAVNNPATSQLEKTTRSAKFLFNLATGSLFAAPSVALSTSEDVPGLKILTKPINTLFQKFGEGGGTVLRGLADEVTKSTKLSAGEKEAFGQFAETVGTLLGQVALGSLLHVTGKEVKTELGPDFERARQGMARILRKAQISYAAIPNKQGGFVAIGATPIEPKKPNGIPPELEPLAEEAKKYKSAEEFVKAIEQDAGGVGRGVEYLPAKRLVETDRNDTPLTNFGFKPDDMVTIYRGVDNASQTEIAAGDYIATSPELAQTYTGGKVISKDVPAKTVRFSSGDGIQTSDFENGFNQTHLEAIYNPNPLLPKSELANFYTKVTGEKAPVPTNNQVLRDIPERIPKRTLSEPEVEALLKESRDLKTKIPLASPPARTVMGGRIREITRQLQMNEVITRKVREKAQRISNPDGVNLSKGGRAYMQRFNASKDQQVIGEKNGIKYELGEFGRNHLDAKLEEGKADRFAESKLGETIQNIKSVYKGSQDPASHRYYTSAWISEMPNGETRLIYTKLNRYGNEEIVGWHVWDKSKNPNFIRDLESNGTPAGTRTRMTSLEPKQSRPLTYGSKSNLPEATSSVKETKPEPKILPPTKAERRLSEKANQEYNRLIQRTAFKDSLKIELPQELQERAMYLALEKERLDNSGYKGLRSALSRRDDLKIQERTGENSYEEAKDKYDKYIKDRKKWERDLREFNAEKSAFYSEARAKRNAKLDEQALNRMADKEAREVLEKDKKNAALKKRQDELKAKENSKQEELKTNAEIQEKYARQVENAHLNEVQKKSLWAKFKSYLAPIAQTDKTTKQIWFNWEVDKLKAREEANKEYEQFVSQPGGELPAIHEYEAGKQIAWIRNEADALFTEAKRAGLPVNYKEQYIPHVYNETGQQVVDAISRYMADQKVDKAVIDAYKKGGEIPEKISVRLKIRPSFTRIRYFPDYRTAIKYGLTPRFRTVAEHFAYYKEEMLKTLANRKLIDDLIKEGKVLNATDAPENWLEIRLPGRAFRQYYAPRDLADALNGQFRDENNLTIGQTIVKYGAKASQIAQEIALSAGVPFTNINFFSIGQAIKMLTAAVGEAAKLNFSGAASSVKAAGAWVRANFNGRSIKFFKDNKRYIDMMGDRNIPIASRIGDYTLNHRTWKQILTWQSLREIRTSFKNFGTDIKNDGLGKAFHNLVDSRLIGIPKDIFDKAFNEKTFTSFMPQMMVQVFKDIYKGARKDGLEEKEAADFAAEVVKNEFGQANAMGRSKTTQDTLGTLIFAPKFREGLINVFTNAAKGLTKEFRNPAFARNRSFVIGTILSYALYNYLNYKQNGSPMWDNEAGHEFDLKIPMASGRIVYITFLPSVLSFVRNLGSSAINFAAGRNDIALQKAGTLLSMPLKIGTEIISNKDYFGRPIYQVTDTPTQKATAVAAYIGLSIVHPWFKEALKYFQGKQDIWQTLSFASELPLKFSTVEKAAISKYYEAKQAKSDLNAQEKADITDTVKVYDQVQKLKADGKLDEASTIIDGLSKKEYQQYQIIMKYEQIQALKKEKRTAEAKALGDQLTDPEYLQYAAIKSIRTGEKRSATTKTKIGATRPQFQAGQQVDNRTLLESVLTYANAIGTDPSTAFNRIFTGQRIRRVDNGAIIVERIPLLESQKIKRDRAATSELRLDHNLPLELGGDNSLDNLKLVPTATWESYTPVENHLGQLLRAKKITKEEAQRLILKFKSGEIPADDIMKL